MDAPRGVAVVESEADLSFVWSEARWRGVPALALAAGMLVLIASIHVDTLGRFGFGVAVVAAVYTGVTDLLHREVLAVDAGRLVARAGALGRRTHFDRACEDVAELFVEDFQPKSGATRYLIFARDRGGTAHQLTATADPALASFLKERLEARLRVTSM